jgi:molybdenum cofactor cytidylyltransferase
MGDSIVSTMPRIVLIAAGFSNRLGSQKLLARVRGTSLVRRMVQTLSPLVRSPLIVVVPPRATRTRAELRGCRVHVVSNAARTGGLSTSVRRGLRAARHASASLLVPIDLVHLKRREIARLISRWRGARRRVVARDIDGRPGAPLILPRRLFARALHIRGDTGLRELVRGLPIDELILMDVPSAAFDVDTPRDLARARRCRKAVTD